MPGTFSYDPPSLAAIIDRDVPGLHVGTAATPIFGRHPLLIPGQAQTVQAPAGDRCHRGLALGTKQLAEAGFGIPHERPIRLLREFLTALRQLVERGSADFHGELLTASPTAEPGAERPVPTPRSAATARPGRRRWCSTRRTWAVRRTDTVPGSCWESWRPVREGAGGSPR